MLCALGFACALCEALPGALEADGFGVLEGELEAELDVAAVAPAAGAPLAGLASDADELLAGDAEPDAALACTTGVAADADSELLGFGGPLALTAIADEVLLFARADAICAACVEVAVLDVAVAGVALCAFATCESCDAVDAMAAAFASAAADKELLLGAAVADVAEDAGALDAADANRLELLLPGADIGGA